MLKAFKRPQVPLSFLTILISFGLHSFIMTSLVFTFKERLSPPQPFFVFLGPILPKTDLILTSKTLPLKDRQTIPVDYLIHTETSDAAARKFSATKPWPSTSPKSETKVLFKSTFYDSPQPPAVEEDTILGINVAAPKRVPLKLQ